MGEERRIGNKEQIGTHYITDKSSVNYFLQTRRPFWILHRDCSEDKRAELIQQSRIVEVVEMVFDPLFQHIDHSVL